MGLPLRQTIDQNMTWDTSLLFKDFDQFKVTLTNFEKDVTQFVNTYQGKLKDTQIILDALKIYEKLLAQVSKLSAYVRLNLDVDCKNSELAEQSNLFINVWGNLAPKMAFITNELAFEHNDLLYSVSEKEPQYTTFINELIKSKAHQLSLEKETLLSELNVGLKHSYEQYNAIKFQDMTFDNFIANGTSLPNSYVLFENDYSISHDTTIRRESAKAFYSTLRRYKNATASVYLAHIKNEKLLAKLRGYSSTIDYLLSGQNVSRELMDRQIDVIMEKFAPVMRRYLKLVAKAHHLDKITHADLKISMPSNYHERITPKQSQAFLKDALKVLGKDYSEMIDKAFEQRWIDFAQNDGKRTGGYCSTIYQGPSFILLNWTGLMNEILVLAHELGHAGHFQLASKQNILNYRPSLYFIEAPSTANEVLACNALLSKNPNKDFQIYLISEFITRTYFHNMVTHLLEAAFQREVYTKLDNNEFLNADILCDIKLNLIKQFWGEDIEIGEDAGLIWMRQPHYYMGLYPYTYSAGLTIGTAMAKKLEENPQTVSKTWLETLSLGASLSPLELAKHAGVDVSTTQPLLDTIQYVSSLVDKLESLM